MLPGSVAELIMTFVAHPCYRRNMATHVTHPGCDALSALAGAYYLPHIRPASYCNGTSCQTCHDTLVSRTVMTSLRG